MYSLLMVLNPSWDIEGCTRYATRRQSCYTSFSWHHKVFVKFCPHLSRVVHPLQDLTHLKQQFIWADQHTKAFQETKHLVSTAPCVRYFDMNSPVVCKSMLRTMVLVLFFSNQASVARSHQKLSGNLLHTALVLTPTEKGYAQIEKETLAIVDAFHNCDPIWEKED